MKLKMNEVLWRALDLDVPSKYFLALSCFYLGKGVEETRELLSRPHHDPEVAFVLEAAAFSGLDPNVDFIEKTGSK